MGPFQSYRLPTFFLYLILQKKNQVHSQPDILRVQEQNLWEQYFCTHLGDCVVLKSIFLFC